MKLVSTTAILKDINERIAGLSCTTYSLSTTPQAFYPFQSGTECKTKTDYSTTCAAKDSSSKRLCCCVVPGEDAAGVCSIEPTRTTAWSGALADVDCPPDDPGYPCIAGKLAGHTGVAVGGRYIYYFGGYTATQTDATDFTQSLTARFYPQNTLFVLDTQGGATEFDPVWADSATSGTTPPARANHVAVLLGDVMYVHGGDIFDGMYYVNIRNSIKTQLADIHRLNTTSREWSGALSVASTLPGARAGHTGVGVGGRYIYYFGGYNATQTDATDFTRSLTARFYPQNTLFVLDTQGGATGFDPVWVYPVTSGTSPSARANHVAVLLGDMMYVHGGDIFDGTYSSSVLNSIKTQLADIHRLNTTSHQWSGALSVAGTAPDARAGHTGVGVGGRYIYYFGGYTATQTDATDFTQSLTARFYPQNTLFVLDTQGGTSGTALVWSAPLTSGDSPSPRANHVAVRIAPSWVFVHGGDIFDGMYFTSVRNSIRTQVADVHRVLANKCPVATYPISDTVCQGCSPGKWSVRAGANLQADSQCEGRCPNGKWSSERGLTASGECLGRCSVGRYGSSTGLQADLECTACPVNTVGSSVGADSAGTCVACEVGKFSLEGAATCTSCGVSTCSVVTSATNTCSGKCSIAGGSEQLTIVGKKLSSETVITVGGSLCAGLQVAVDGTTATCTLPQSSGGSTRIFINDFDFTMLAPVVYECPSNSIPIGDACQLCNASTRAPFMVGTSMCTPCTSNEVCPLGATAAMPAEAVLCDSSTSSSASYVATVPRCVACARSTLLACTCSRALRPPAIRVSRPRRQIRLQQHRAHTAGFGR